VRRARESPQRIIKIELRGDDLESEKWVKLVSSSGVTLTVHRNFSEANETSWEEKKATSPERGKKHDLGFGGGGGLEGEVGRGSWRGGTAKRIIQRTRTRSRTPASCRDDIRELYSHDNSGADLRYVNLVVATRRLFHGVARRKINDYCGTSDQRKN
jgi:hypothetical protein